MQVAPGPDGAGFTHHGGNTVILSPHGEVRFIVLKCLLAEGRIGRRREYLQSDLGRRHWLLQDGRLLPREGVLRRLHDCGLSVSG